MPRVSRLAAYGLISTGLAAAVVGSALRTRPNFFAAAVSVGKSNGSLMVLANFVLWLSIICGVGFKNVFFGELRPVEYEHLFERLWIFLTESLFALTIFRSNYTMPFALLYDFLVFLKCFHWITADRVDYIDQVPPPGPPMGFHVRIVTVTSLLTMFDVLLLIYSAESVLVDGPSAMILFASEFAILLASIIGTWARYIVGLIDLRRAGGRADAPAWEEKSMYLFYVDLIVDFAKLLTYLVFFIVIFLNYGFPVHIVRDVYMTLRSFIARGTDLVRYRRATRNMDQLYPDATAEELAQLGDTTCIICREEMVARGAAGADEGQPPHDGPNETPKKLACGHVFHFHCLRSWLERQQSCPTCRRDVLRDAGNANQQPAQPPVAGAGAQDAAGQARGPAGDEAERMRAMFEDYFRLPPVNGDAPVMLPPPQEPPAANAHNPQANGQRAGSAPPASEPLESDQRVQRSIWGAPIVPGRFIPPPLGSARRWPEAGPSRPPPAPGNDAADSAPVSGTSTPFTSRPPQVFTSTGIARTGPRTKGATAATEAEAEGSQTQAQAVDDDDVPLREAMAAAALRRAGLVDKVTAGLNKGKGRAAPEDLEEEKKEPSFDDAPTHRAFLTPSSLSGLAFPTSAGGPATAAAPLPRTPEAARAALEERLAALRGVDEVVWSLVGELSRLKSAWEVEDGVERRDE